MEVIDARVNWHEGFDNDPTLQVLVNRRVPIESFRYKFVPATGWSLGLSNQQSAVIGGSAVNKTPHVDFDDIDLEVVSGFFYAEKDGAVNYLYHDAKDRRGFSGSGFILTMEDGRKVGLKGPWASRASLINRLTELTCVDVSITDDPEAFKRGHTFTASAITLSLAQRATVLAAKHEPRKMKINLARETDGSEIRYTPRREVPYYSTQLPNADSIVLGIIRDYEEVPQKNYECTAHRAVRHFNKYYGPDWRRLL